MESLTVAMLIVIICAIGLWFSIITASIITNALGVVGWDWWIVFLTLLGALGGCGGSLININRKN